jgi:hypothetical protein
MKSPGQFAAEMTSKGWVEVHPGVWEKPKFLPPVAGEPERIHAPVDRERELHDDIEAYCLSMGWLYRHDRMDKPTTGQVGWPDFVIFMPDRKVCFIECKKRGGKATTAQLAKLAHARKLGFVAEIVDNKPDAIQAMDKARRL